MPPALDEEILTEGGGANGRSRKIRGPRKWATGHTFEHDFDLPMPTNPRKATRGGVAPIIALQ